MNPFEDLLGLSTPPPTPSETPQYLWATVVSVTPLLIRMDGDSAPLAVSPTPLMNPKAIETGIRVLVLHKGRSIYIMGSDQLKDPGGIAPGTLLMYAGDTEPEGYLFARGQIVLETAYPALFIAISSRYGSAPAGYFALPDMRGRTPVGMAPGDSDFGALNAFPGAKTHTLTAAQTPVLGTNSAGGHTHSLVDDNFWVTSATGTFPAGSYYGGTTKGAAAIKTNTAGAHTHTVNSGGGGAHNNIQPSRVVNFIIKT